MTILSHVYLFEFIASFRFKYFFKIKHDSTSSNEPKADDQEEFTSKFHEACVLLALSFDVNMFLSIFNRK